MNTHKMLPKFKNYEEEANFWDTHDMTDYVDLKTKVTLEYCPKRIKKKDTLILRVQPEVKTKMENMANSYGIATSTLARMFIINGIREHKEERKLFKTA